MTMKFLRLPEVKSRTGFSRSSIYLFVQNGTFPRPVRIGGRAVAWLETEIDAWIEERLAERGES
ncbi:putative transcriptional regulator [Thalassovita autumnalis]|uniref:Transcriptional regulator n=1 Tax=Thalassovita autumnalis TaxID=2072972 RepID=A0A0P1FQ61_9RHOB|nr:AlpA family transcriptional regulator [Thalassovita autumnalis]CUH64651.1 putative transcriptional regulator [Thalassovita autumnalis]CUH70412.1 putative transcriptional regulator [Thalassovita autumnalis]